MVELLAMPKRAEIIDPLPDFTWIVNSGRRDDVQPAYQVQVAASRPALSRAKEQVAGNSGVVKSDRSTAVEYAGRPLANASEYLVAVRTWDRAAGRAAGRRRSGFERAYCAIRGRAGGGIGPASPSRATRSRRRGGAGERE